jgi:hypothetical protein
MLRICWPMSLALTIHVALTHRLLGPRTARALCITANFWCPCPLWVKSRHSMIFGICPLYPQKRTLVERSAMSAKCQKQEFRTAASNLIIRAPRPCWRHRNEKHRVRENVSPLFYVSSKNRMEERCCGAPASASVRHLPASVRVNAVSPEPTRTEGTAAMGDALQQFAAQAGRPAEPEEIVEAIVFHQPRQFRRGCDCAGRWRKILSPAV